MVEWLIDSALLIHLLGYFKVKTVPFDLICQIYLIWRIILDYLADFRIVFVKFRDI